MAVYYDCRQDGIPWHHDLNLPLKLHLILLSLKETRDRSARRLLGIARKYNNWGKISAVYLK